MVVLLEVEQISAWRGTRSSTVGGGLDFRLLLEASLPAGGAELGIPPGRVKTGLPPGRVKTGLPVGGAELGLPPGRAKTGLPAPIIGKWMHPDKWSQSAGFESPRRGSYLYTSIC